VNAVISKKQLEVSNKTDDSGAASSGYLLAVSAGRLHFDGCDVAEEQTDKTEV
jgi:hypothetical protein